MFCPRGLSISSIVSLVLCPQVIKQSLKEKGGCRKGGPCLEQGGVFWGEFLGLPRAGGKEEGGDFNLCWWSV